LNAIAGYERDDYHWLKEAFEKNPHMQSVIHIPNTEPIFVLRSQDIYGPETVDFWLSLAQRVTNPEKFQRAAAEYQAMLEWQNKNQNKVKIPD
jgi:hypothetical protein